MVVVSERVAVRISSPDAISRAGLLAQLAHRPEVRLLHDDDEADAAVTVILADEVDEAVLQRVRSARRTAQGGRVTLVVTRLDDGSLLKAVEAGASSILRRDDASADRIIEAVRSSAGGAGSMPPDLLGRLLDQLGRLQRDVLGPRGIMFSGLTEREVEVLRLIADGYDTAEVGRRLFYSERTVKNVIHDITSRLNLRNRTHAVAYALRQGFI